MCVCVRLMFLCSSVDKLDVFEKPEKPSFVKCWHKCDKNVLAENINEYSFTKLFFPLFFPSNFILLLCVSLFHISLERILPSIQRRAAK